MNHMMKNLLIIILVAIPAFLLSDVHAQHKESRKSILIDHDWKFTLGHATDISKDFFYGAENNLSKSKSKGVNYSGIAFDDSGWEAIDLPHDWAVALPFSPKGYGSHGYKSIGKDFPENSIGWYRKKIRVDSTDLCGRLELQFDGVFRDCKVWVNGIFIKSHMSGYTGFKCDITDIVQPGENVVTVRVDATQVEGWFYEGAGIYRHVWLNVYDNLHFEGSGTFIYTESIKPEAKLIINNELVNNFSTTKDVVIENIIMDANGKIVAKSVSKKMKLSAGQKDYVQQNIAVANPRLWNLDQPYQYTLVSKIISEGKPHDVVKTKFGIRIFSYTKDGFFLNGEKVLIKGVCCHQDHAGVGVALPDELQYYRIRLLKDMGVNAYRASHNPPTTELLNVCDSLGILVMSETRLLNSGNEYMNQFENLIRRDRNHASVFMWCIGNEEEMIQTTATGKNIARSMIELQRSLDPSRVSTYGANVGNTREGVSEVIPVRGFNYNLYGLKDYKRDNPEHPVIGTEVASTVSTRGVYVPDKMINKTQWVNGNFYADLTKSYLLDQDASYPSWASTAEQWFKQTADEGWFMGGFVWTGFDYRGEPTPFSWPNINSHFGVMDVCGFPKNVYYYYKSWWGKDDVLHIAPHWNINVKKNEPVNVWVYSNAERVELFLNNKSLGIKQMPENSHLNWTVNYEPGTIRAVGYRDGRKIETNVTTTGTPVKIKLEPHKNSMRADGHDAVVINVSALDSKGMEVPDASDLITFKLEGDAKIIGVGNGDPSSHEPDQYKNGDYKRSLFNGKCQVIIEAGNKDGDIKFSAASKGLEGKTISIKQYK